MQMDHVEPAQERQIRHPSRVAKTQTPWSKNLHGVTQRAQSLGVFKSDCPHASTVRRINRRDLSDTHTIPSFPALRSPRQSCAQARSARDAVVLAVRPSETSYKTTQQVTRTQLSPRHDQHQLPQQKSWSRLEQA